MKWVHYQSCLLLSFIISMVIAQCSVRAQVADDAAKDDNPKLLALTWQHINRATGRSSDIPWWTPDGEIVPDETLRELQAELKGMEIRWRKDSSEQLILMLEHKDQLKSGDRGISARLLFDDHRRSLGSSRNRYQGRTTASRMFSVSSIDRVITNGQFEWPKKVDLTFRFPVEETQVIKTLTEYPQKPVEFGKGVSWAVEPEAGYIPGGDGRRFPAGVLTFSNDQIEMLEYSVGIFRNGSNRRLKEAFVTNRDIDGDTYEIRVSEELPKIGELDRIEFYRRRFRRTELKDVAVRTDLLPDRKPR